MTVAFYPKDAELEAWMDRHGHKGAWLADLARLLKNPRSEPMCRKHDIGSDQGFRILGNRV